MYEILILSRRTELLITHKSRQIRKCLSENIKKFKIFFVSNHLYWDHVQQKQSEVEHDSFSSEGEDVTDQGVESAETLVKLSGIDLLREHFQSMTARARKRATSDFINQDVVAHLNSLSLWATDGSDQFSQAKLHDFKKIVAVVSGGFQKVNPIIITLYTGYASDSRP